VQTKIEFRILVQINSARLIISYIQVDQQARDCSMLFINDLKNGYFKEY